MPGDGTPSGRAVGRRAVLGGLAAAGAALAGCSALEPGGDATTTPVGEDRARDLAVEFAPTLYFDEHERWFPTDPRPYATEAPDGTVVRGFDALNGYVEGYEGGDPPAPTVFYHAVQYESSPLAVVQFWMYSAFDQFTTNFHWHDWEVLHAFVDTDAGEPQLYVASSHSRRVPNNEFLDPTAGTVPRVLSELGSHSSALSVNADPDRFQRFPTGVDVADITNGAIEGLGDLAEFPAAYGLPRDEGGRLPYLVPELDGAPVHEHDRLPAVDRSDLIPPELTVRSFDALASPPADLPGRGTGSTFGHADRAEETDLEYELVPAAEVEHIDAFTGPQLSFEFAVPAFAEDAVSSHITTAGVPWEQSRYDNPALDITDPTHRAALAERYDAVGDVAPVNAVLAAVSTTGPAEEAPDGKGLATGPLPTEAVALLESEATALPTFRGVAMARDVPAGDHRLTVNGAGVAPHSETVSVAGDGPTTGGVSGEIPLVARDRATKLEVDPRGVESDLTDLAVADDFAGRLYDSPLGGPDAVYVDRRGAFTAEVRDADDAVGAFRLVPTDEAAVRIETPRTGKASLADFVADIAAETAAEVGATVGDDGGSTPGGSPGGTATLDVRPAANDTGTGTATPTPTATGDATGGPSNAVRGLARALEALASAARRAARRAEAGDRSGADRSLDAVSTALDRVAERLAAAREGLPPGVANATDRRLDQARRRAEQAKGSEKL